MKAHTLWSLLLLIPALACASEDARTIMEKVDAQQRAVADGTLTRSQLSSCKFGLKDKAVACVEEPRVKRMESTSRQLGADKKDSQSIAILLEPASERGIGMLTYTYADESKETESWLYLSALGRVKRMVSGAAEDQEPVSLFGSEFSTEDMENGKTDEYRYQILQEGDYDGTQVWVIEGLPNEARLRKSRYSKIYFWIDKARYVPLKVQAYDKRGQLFKRILFRDIQQLDGLWLARDLTLLNVQTSRLSTMRTEAIALHVTLDDDFLTQRTLTDFAYRERELERLRAQFQ